MCILSSLDGLPPLENISVGAHEAESKVWSKTLVNVVTSSKECELFSWNIQCFMLVNIEVTQYCSWWNYLHLISKWAMNCWSLLSMLVLPAQASCHVYSLIITLLLKPFHFYVINFYISYGNCLTHKTSSLNQLPLVSAHTFHSQLLPFYRPAAHLLDQSNCKHHLV